MPISHCCIINHPKASWLKSTTIILLPLPISIIRNLGTRGKILVWGPSGGCNETAAGARAAEGLEQLQSCWVSLSPCGLSLHVVSPSELVWTSSPPGNLRAIKCSSASILAPNTAAASTLMTGPQKSLLPHSVGYKWVRSPPRFKGV